MSLHHFIPLRFLIWTVMGEWMKQNYVIFFRVPTLPSQTWTSTVCLIRWMWTTVDPSHLVGKLICFFLLQSSVQRVSLIASKFASDTDACVSSEVILIGEVYIIEKIAAKQIWKNELGFDCIRTRPPHREVGLGNFNGLLSVSEEDVMRTKHKSYKKKFCKRTHTTYLFLLVNRGISGFHLVAPRVCLSLYPLHEGTNRDNGREQSLRSWTSTNSSQGLRNAHKEIKIHCVSCQDSKIQP